MFLTLYSIVYEFAFRLAQIASVFSPKVKEFLNQRNQWKSSLFFPEKSKYNKTVFWFHTASLGEFEQARPLIEKYQKTYPNAFIALTFFSASGYSVQQKYSEVDWVGYLPLDRKKDVSEFIDRLNPNALFLVKYEFWPRLILSLKQKNIPVYSISSIFRPAQLFFKPLHFGMRKVLKAIDHFFVQNKTSVQLLNGIDIDKVTLSGDTRFDRVLDIADQKIDLPKIKAFIQGDFCFVAGSTWPEDHAVILPPVQKEEIKIIIAPHKIDENTLTDIEEKLILPFTRWSKFQASDSAKNILILDCIGLLSKVYAYADAVYVGGGLGNSGLHNTLEPAVFGIPLIIGPNYDKFDEAIALVNNKGTFSINNSTDFEIILKELLSSGAQCKAIGKRNINLVKKRAGAVNQIFSALNQK